MESLVQLGYHGPKPRVASPLVLVEQAAALVPVEPGPVVVPDEGVTALAFLDGHILAHANGRKSDALSHLDGQRFVRVDSLQIGRGGLDSGDLLHLVGELSRVQVRRQSQGRLAPGEMLSAGNLAKDLESRLDGNVHVHLVQHPKGGVLY